MLCEVKKVSHSFDGRTVLKDISFSLDYGEILGIIGPNGGGKSTLLKIIAGAITKESGEIILSNPSPITYIPQTKDLNVTLPVTTSEFITFEDGPHELSEVLKLIGLDEKGDYLLSHLSGGERQRALLGKALRKDPTLLLLDEPTTGLDMSGQDQLFSILKKIRANKKCGIILIDHNIRELLAICDKILCLNKSFHWHSKREDISQEKLENIYHCEFEHLLLHTTPEGITTEHTHCGEPHQHVHKGGR